MTELTIAEELTLEYILKEVLNYLDTDDDCDFYTLPELMLLLQHEDVETLQNLLNKLKH